jgi:hypothetical protein
MWPRSSWVQVAGHVGSAPARRRMPTREDLSALLDQMELPSNELEKLRPADS